MKNPKKHKSKINKVKMKSYFMAYFKTILKMHLAGDKKLNFKS